MICQNTSRLDLSLALVHFNNNKNETFGTTTNETDWKILSSKLALVRTNFKISTTVCAFGMIKMPEKNFHRFKFKLN